MYKLFLVFDNQQAFHVFQGEYCSKEWRTQQTCEFRKCTFYTEGRTKHLMVIGKGANDRGRWAYWQHGEGGMKCDVRQIVYIQYPEVSC